MERKVLRIIASAFVLAAAAPAHASVFFSEYIEGSSNNKALEIFNSTTAALDFSAGSYFVDIYFNGATTAGETISLNGSVAAGDVYVLAHSSANATVLALANQTTGDLLFNGNDALVLRQDSTILDVFGQIGFDPGASWGSGTDSTANNTLLRLDTVVTGDTTGSNAFNPSLEWRGLGNDNFTELGSATLAAIPEPQTYAMLLAGLGLLGFALRRKGSVVTA